MSFIFSNKTEEEYALTRKAEEFNGMQANAIQYRGQANHCYYNICESNIFNETKDILDASLDRPFYLLYRHVRGIYSINWKHLNYKQIWEKDSKVPTGNQLISQRSIFGGKWSSLYIYIMQVCLSLKDVPLIYHQPENVFTKDKTVDDSDCIQISF